MDDIKIGDFCKHFKGKDLIEKNIYQILLLNVIYSGDYSLKKINDLVIYKNIFDGKIFAREASDIFAELSLEKQKEYNQVYRVQKLTDEEILEINSLEYKEKKLQYINKK